MSAEIFSIIVDFSLFRANISFHVNSIICILFSPPVKSYRFVENGFRVMISKMRFASKCVAESQQKWIGTNLGTKKPKNIYNLLLCLDFVNTNISRLLNI